MQLSRISGAELRSGFELIGGTERAQAAVMVLDPETRTGGPDNRHSDSDQWLFVLEGSGRVTVEDKAIEIAEGHLILIEKGETHEVANTGASALKTLNIYAPPAY
jgi:mannose-6-phosphate isomerase-like protein (cupin superfamily)